MQPNTNPMIISKSYQTISRNVQDPSNPSKLLSFIPYLKTPKSVFIPSLINNHPYNYKCSCLVSFFSQLSSWPNPYPALPLCVAPYPRPRAVSSRPLPPKWWCKTAPQVPTARSTPQRRLKVSNASPRPLPSSTQASPARLTQTATSTGAWPTTPAQATRRAPSATAPTSAPQACTARSPWRTGPRSAPRRSSPGCRGAGTPGPV